MRVIHNSVLDISEENGCLMMENGTIFTLSKKVLHEDNDYQTSNNTCKLIFYMMSWSTPFYVVYVVLMPFYIPWTAL